MCESEKIKPVKKAKAKDVYAHPLFVGMAVVAAGAILTTLSSYILLFGRVKALEAKADTTTPESITTVARGVIENEIDRVFDPRVDSFNDWLDDQRPETAKMLREIRSSHQSWLELHPSVSEKWARIEAGEGWLNYANGENPETEHEAGYFVSKDGWVHLRGAIKIEKNTDAAGLVVAALPDELRPESHIIAGALADLKGGVHGIVRLDIDNSLDEYSGLTISEDLLNERLPKDTDFISMQGIQYPAANPQEARRRYLADIE